MAAAPVVTDHPDAGRYEIAIDGERVGLLTYRLKRDVITMLHAEIDPAHGGQGLGTTLARGALEDARTRGLTVEPICPFVVDFIRRHPDDYADLVRPPRP